MYDKNVLDLVDLESAEWVIQDEEYMFTEVVVSGYTYKIYAEYQQDIDGVDISVVDIEYVDNKPRH